MDLLYVLCQADKTQLKQYETFCPTLLRCVYVASALS